MAINLQYRVRPMFDTDLEQVLEWRNHPDVNRYMYTQHKIVLAEHTQWFEVVSKDPSYHLLIFEVDNIPLGFINIHQIGEGGIADWGFYVAPTAPKGTGALLGESALHYAFLIAKLHKICGQALGYNAPSIRFHQRLGFREEGNLREQHFDGQNYHDVMHFGLLASEWRTHN